MDKKNMLVQWNGEDGYCWKAELGIVDKAPCVLELGYEAHGFYNVLARNLVPQFKVITSERTKNNPQRSKGLAPGEVLGYQWDTYSDDPMSRRDKVKEAVDQWDTSHISQEKDGNRISVYFDGLTLGQFQGGCRFNFFEGSNLIRIEAVAATEEDGVA